MKAVIDIGTNSIKFCLAESDGKGGFNVVKDANDIARLGEGLRETGVISGEALERNAQSVKNFADTAKQAGADEIAVVGTMALRTAKNTPEFAARVKELCGLDVRVVPGEEEARLAFVAAASAVKGAGDRVVFDTGGGSTEFVFGSGANITKRFSVNVGAVRITEQFFGDDPVAAGSIEKACAEIESNLNSGGLDPVKFGGMVVGMGGTITSMASVKFKMDKYDPDVVHGSDMTEADVDSQIAQYSKMKIEERKTIKGLQPKRADVILAGACIVKTVLKMLGAPKFTVSDRGLRHAMMLEMFNK